MNYPRAKVGSCSAQSQPAIILVDDEESILPEYQELLAFEGFTSLACSDPEQAVRMVLDEPAIRLVITDLRMAGLDGAGLVDKLSAVVPEDRNLKFIILTGDSTQDFDKLAPKAIVLFKPPNPDELIGAIEAALSEPR